MSGEDESSHPLFSLPPGVVYWMADGLRTRRGLEYLERGRVLDFRWEKKSGSLRARVLGSRRYVVTLDADGGELRCMCSCADASRGIVCKHAVAAAGAFFAATRGTRHFRKPLPRDYLKELHRGIAGESSEPVVEDEEPVAAGASGSGRVSYALGLVFSDRRGWSTVGLEVAGERVREDDWAPGGQYLRARFNRERDVCEAVLDYLEQERDPWPVFVRLDGTWYPVAGVAPEVLDVHAELMRRDGEVHATFRFVSGDNEGGEPKVSAGLTARIGLTADARLVRLNPDAFVRAVSVLHLVLLSTERIGMRDESRDSLPYLHWTLPAAMHNLGAEVLFGEPVESADKASVTFFEGKRTVRPTPAPARFSLRFERDGRGSDIFVANVYWEAPGFSVPLAVGAETIDHVLGSVTERRFFMKKSRAAHLAEALTELAAEPDAETRRKLASEVLDRGSLGDRGMVNAAKALVRRFETELAATCRWVFAHPGSGKPAPWVETELPLREILFCELLVTAIFVPSELRDRFRGGASLGVSPEALAAGLPALFSQCRERDVSLMVDGNPVGTASLEVAVAVQPSRERRDWFELKPEIRLGGRTLSTEDWEAIAERGGVVETRRGPAVLDIDSLERLKRARDLLRSREGADGAKNAVQVSRLEVFEWLDLKRCGVRLKLPKEGRNVLESLARFRKLEPAPLPEGLRAELREYQKSGYDWLAFLYRHRFGACLADDMGLGKTVQAIALFAALNEGAVASARAARTRPHLVVAPSSLLFNWRAEIERFAPGLTVCEYTGAGRSAGFDGADVVLTTYEIVRRDREVLRKRGFHVLVFDEAQAVKNRSGGRHKAARDLVATFRVCLTGTPVENHLGEYQAILDLALPGIFHDLEGRNRPGPEALERRVLARSRPFVLRRTKTAVLAQLPPKTETDVMLEPAPRQKALYVREVARVRAEVAEAYDRMPSGRAGVVALSALNRLRLLCVSPALLDPGEPPVSPKFDFALEAVSELVDEGNAVLVFSQFVKALNLFEARLKEAGIASIRLEGKTTRKQRKDRVQRFQSGEGPAVFLLSLKAGGVGLNLTRANHVIHLDPWWNPAVENQASDRAHRIGQERKVLIQRLSLRDTIEEKIAALKADKRALYERVLGTDKKPAGAAALTREDLAFLLDGEA